MKKTEKLKKQKQIVLVARGYVREGSEKMQIDKGINRWVVWKRKQIALGDHREKGSKITEGKQLCK